MSERMYLNGGDLHLLCSKDDLAELCIHAVTNGSHELRLVSNELPWAATAVGLEPLANRRLTYDELKNVVSAAFGDIPYGHVVGGNPQNPSFIAKVGRDRAERFRVNISSGYRRGDGLMIVMRHIPQKIPSLQDISMPDEITDHAMALDRGVVMFVGAVGTGKSTSMASIIQHRLQANPSETFVSGEEPIEFTYDDADASVFQMEVGRNIDSFKQSIRNFLRQTPSIYLLGEARDAESIDMVIRAGSVGPLVFTTGHAKDIVSTIPRLVGEYELQERDTALETIIEGLNMVVSQTLVPSICGTKRVALREYLILSESVKDALHEATVKTVRSIMREVMKSNGVSMRTAAERAYAEGKISEATLNKTVMAYG